MRWTPVDGGAVDEFWVRRDELMELYSANVLEYEERHGLPPPTPVSKATNDGKPGKKQTKAR